MPAVLAVDLGKTSCRAALWVEDEVPLTALGEGAAGLASEGGLVTAEQAIRSVCNAVLARFGELQSVSVCIGAAGAIAAPDVARTLAGRLTTLIPTGGVAVCSDALAAHAGALDGRPGLVLVAGTGAVVIGVGHHARYVQVDGWGPVLGDCGGGYSIGLSGLRAALRSHDGRAVHTPVEDAARRRFGELDRLPLALLADRNEVRTVAAFAPEVAALAASGDRTCLGIMEQAATRLAESVRAAVARFGEPDTPVALAGGLQELGPPLLQPLKLALESAWPSLSAAPAHGTALDGARLLAVRRDTVHDPFVERVAA
jgi:glucosamine kinase